MVHVTVKPTTICCCGLSLETGVKLFCAWYCFKGILSIVEVENEIIESEKQNDAAVIAEEEDAGKNGEDMEGWVLWYIIRIVYDMICLMIVALSLKKKNALQKRIIYSTYAYRMVLFRELIQSKHRIYKFHLEISNTSHICLSIGISYN
jgi:hypothetical protein